MVSTATERVVTKADAKVTHAILLELDTVALAGRSLLFDIVKKRLSDEDVTLNDKLFIRYCVDVAPNAFVKDLIASSGKTKISDSKVTESVQQAFRVKLAAEAGSIPAGLRKILDHARSRQHEVGILTTLDAESVAPAAEALGITDASKCVLSFNGDSHPTPTAHEWLRLTKQMAIRPNACLAIVSSMRSCKAALAAGIRSIVMCDRFTTFQDFGGADYVVPALNDAAAKDIMELISHRIRTN